eukprot:jgi/Undpi1/8261/HiC_scaffold_25.g10731.m1
MYAPAIARSPARDGVAFDEGPYLIKRHGDGDDNSGAVVEEVVARAGEEEEEDDSVAMVFSADTGAGRAHTPQRLNRTNTPQRRRSSGLIHTVAAPVQQAPAVRGGGEARRQPLGRRKQRRWENDNLLGVEKFLRGRHAHEEGEAEHLTVSHPRRSSLSLLVSDQNKSANAVEIRESIRKGLQPTRCASEEASKPGARRFVGRKWEVAEQRFLLVERRLRDIVVRALRSSALLDFMVGLEDLLEGFAQGGNSPADMPPALRSALRAKPTVERGVGLGHSASATLLVPLGPSPFHRLLLHALCQYQMLRSKSEETSGGRVVCVTIPTSHSSLASPGASLTEFIVQTRLRGTGDGGAVEGRRSQTLPSSRAPERCGEPDLGTAQPAPSGVMGVA